MTNFKTELTTLINKYNIEADSGTPDFILADYLVRCLDTYGEAATARNEWYNRATRAETGGDHA